jgi:hypothetical protein
MLPFLPLHTLAAQRGDGLRPELLALFERHAKSTPGLSAPLVPEIASANQDPPDPPPPNAEPPLT